MNWDRLPMVILIFWMLLNFGVSEGDSILCVQRNVLPAIDVGSSSSESSKNEVDKPFFNWGGELLDDNYTIRCHSNIYCFTLWTSDGHNKSKVTVLKQGCWIGEPNVCIQDQCVSSMAPKNNSHFCCCSGDMCNENFTDGYNPAAHTTTPITPSHPLQDNSYKTKTIIISLLSVFSVAFFVIIAYIGFRMCIQPKQPSVESILTTEIPALPAEFDMDDLKLCHIISKGRYSEVWKGKLGEEDAAVKIYTQHYREYYNNERTLYRLPFMDHDGIVKFYGADERITQDGSPQLMIVMSYVPLGSLCGYLKNNILDWPSMVRMALSVARGLSHLHTDIQKGDQFKPVLAHRDINTRNILVRSDLNCVITDLGFAVATMGSKLIKKGHPEIAEQTSLTDVGTLRYMAPELLDGAVNLRDCEASLKQIDVYAMGLVLWEIASRCVDLYQGAPVPEYASPYQMEAGSNPTFEEMQMLVVRAKCRPKFPEVWKETNHAVRSLKETIEECWDADAEARLTALCVEERISDLPNLWAHEAKHRGMISTVNSMSSSGDKSDSDNTHNIDTVVDASTAHLTLETDAFAGTCVRPLSQFSLHTGITTQNDNTTGVMLYSNGHIPIGDILRSPSVSLTQLHKSWIQDRSVSASTTDTIIPLTPAESSAPAPKASNLLQERNNAVLRPHQGRNPTVERNTHKCSDEELRVSGNTLISNNRRDSLSTQSAPIDHPSAESPPDFVGDGLEASLVQNDALSHRNPPIPYLQNHVHGNVPVGRPKVANTSSLRSYQRGERSLREKLSKLIRPKELGLRLSGLSIFGHGRRHVYSRAEDLEVDDLQHEQTTLESSRQGNSDQQPGTVLDTQTANISQVQTEVCLQNGIAIIRPVNISVQNTLNSDQQTHSTGVVSNGHQENSVDSHTQYGGLDISSAESNHLQSKHSVLQQRYPENRLRFAEVGIAKLHIPAVCQQPVRRLQGTTHSKSTSELLQLQHHNGSPSCWQETELSTAVDSYDAKRRRPNSLSLKGHNYSTIFKPSIAIKSLSKPELTSKFGLKKQEDLLKTSHNLGNSGSDVSVSVVHCTDELISNAPHASLDHDSSDESEKIRRRVKTPIRPSKKPARLSLYDDRLMSSELDVMMGKDSSESALRKSYTSSKLSNHNNNNINHTFNDRTGNLPKQPALSNGYHSVPLKGGTEVTFSDTIVI